MPNIYLSTGYTDDNSGHAPTHVTALYFLNVRNELQNCVSAVGSGGAQGVDWEGVHGL